MEASISVGQGMLFLDSPSSVCSDEPLLGDLLVFRGSLNNVNEALADVVYKVTISISQSGDRLFVPRYHMCSARVFFSVQGIHQNGALTKL